MTAESPDPGSAKPAETESATSGRAPLERVRTEPRAHAAALLVIVIVGLAAAWLHWLGLVLGGALVGVVSRSLPRAVLGGVGFGVVVLVVFVASLGPAVGPALEMTPVSYLVVATALGLPVLGSLVRGVV
ncbi:hypothetical protein [Natronobeatus ordinarius]|uniref:hypothetical protein n=1 Tax=Natronobeatus ordinarius TaxID=2963433 RepID=UPI0020CD53DB|nr:hypothetical protein [Natronobeatus ordinarius]